MAPHVERTATLGLSFHSGKRQEGGEDPTESIDDRSYPAAPGSDTRGIVGTVGYILAGNRRWPLTEDELLWAGRAAVGETGSSAGQIAVLWSWAQLLVQRAEAGHACLPCRGQPCRPQTFGWAIRCHSQPVNEYWRFRGDNQARRQMLAAASWAKLEQLSSGIKGRVYSFARGEYPNPVPRLADFSRPGQPDVPAGARVVGGNAFFTEGRSGSWPDNYVQIVKATGLGAASPLGKIVITGGIALLTYLGWRLVFR